MTAVLLFVALPVLLALALGDLFGGDDAPGDGRQYTEEQCDQWAAQEARREPSDPPPLLADRDDYC